MLWVDASIFSLSSRVSYFITNSKQYTCICRKLISSKSISKNDNLQLFEYHLSKSIWFKVIVYLFIFLRLRLCIKSCFLSSSWVFFRSKYDRNCYMYEPLCLWKFLNAEFVGKIIIMMSLLKSVGVVNDVSLIWKIEVNLNFMHLL